MPELRLDWPAIAKDLARALHSVSDLALIRHLLDDAQQDALALGAPSSFWSRVLSEYEQTPAVVVRPDGNLVRRMILLKARELGTSA